jgi:hypothetical protein
MIRERVSVLSYTYICPISFIIYKTAVYTEELSWSQNIWLSLHSVCYKTFASVSK